MESTDTKTKAVPHCKWCGEEATRIDYREVDGMTSKIYSCDTCFRLDTKYLLEKYSWQKK